MKKKLFGKNIAPDCRYCEHSFFENGIFACEKQKSNEKGNCRKFKYDPLMRVPVSITLRSNYSPEDFKL